jgi:hypothetical protein
MAVTIESGTYRTNVCGSKRLVMYQGTPDSATDTHIVGGGRIRFGAIIPIEATDINASICRNNDASVDIPTDGTYEAGTAEFLGQPTTSPGQDYYFIGE